MFKLTDLRHLLLGAALSSALFAVTASAQNSPLANVSLSDVDAAWSDDFQSRPLNTNLLNLSTGGWKRNTSTWPTGSTAIVHASGNNRYLTITSQGDPTYNARVGARDFPTLSITDSSNNYFGMDIRWLSPGSSESYLARAGSAQFKNGNDIVLKMGIDADGLLELSFGGGQSYFSDSVVDKNAWYRFKVLLAPETGGASFVVVQMNGDIEGQVIWSDALTDLNLIGQVTSLELLVNRPGGKSTDYRSIDFDNLIVGTVAVPEPATTAVIMLLGVGAVVAFKRRRRA